MQAFLLLESILLRRSDYLPSTQRTVSLPLQRAGFGFSSFLRRRCLGFGSCLRLVGCLPVESAWGACGGPWEKLGLTHDVAVPACPARFFTSLHVDLHVRRGSLGARSCPNCCARASTDSNILATPIIERHPTDEQKCETEAIIF